VMWPGAAMTVATLLTFSLSVQKIFYMTSYFSSFS